MGGSPSYEQGSTTQYSSELPEVMARKLGLADWGSALAMGQPAYESKHGAGSWETKFGGALDPRTLPKQDIAGFTDLQKRAQEATGAEGGIGGYQKYLDKAQGYMGPDAYQQFLNPYQDYVTKGIEEQFGKAQTAADAQGVQTGAFGGARQGLQSAELSRQQADAVGGSLAQGYGQAQQMAGQAAQQQLGLAGQSQQMGMGDISSMMQAGAQQQGLTQQGYDEAYRRSIQQMYEPYQRLGFASDIMQGAPTSASALTMATTPQANPISQAVGAGISGLALYQGYQNLANPSTTQQTK
tara:strand:+ start:249 stop:1139 length:891 start_codon:yes stop_codon:yes gene_type:complete